ncbi:hypothetical protein BBK36DRAFT_1181842 [Trichoderma citrinoviride]|uniref:Uncharacterized protein n=1 Tax=Trichoderma citrinoviride TaxID=58853 RepID=A0A2T4B258_9HYPO|nr:hypothetical protein BBK36DRAFT_1181842 [Trichoderma citrinoviride]PTB63407.1 hypothetical protein BBK36DRAFT_1181842 [Trichoderma citrinoviride]
MAPTLRERKAGPDGTKVTLGQDAPVTREGPGVVQSESLAAQSLHSGGEFSNNRSSETEAISGSDLKTQAGRGGEDSNGAPAPNYVVDQYLTGKGGPHGKNIKEGIDESELRGKESDGLQKALRAEPGSENDPSRLAEERMLERDTLRAEGSGPRQGGVEGGTKYDGLENEVSS